eukprot:CAMPEP_0198244222 /NCGR_PEP_ID=MMETSP1446-20131203/33729_1 /TAXON_ID=1461542 ORGANISM="Unidentified sp, Strain CCMP2111" /NCGR_SAMPLE_ID=MMETSP1446 /ASSEMBLY_ACC=CAM_ASM_001112 /LENGTH=727 /DNA_ID=CAMNT_0043928221 /DNA_START=62 /DNA_END=2245 /DNA_ORIENTATION=+
MTLRRFDAHREHLHLLDSNAWTLCTPQPILFLGEMWVLLLLVGLPVILLSVGWHLKRMPVASTSTLVKVNVGVSWIAALSIVLLVPADIAETISLYPNGNAEAETKSSASTKFLAVAWQVVYWYAFLALFTILPFHQEYADCGAFHTADKVKYSLRQNALFYLFVAGAGVSGVLILLASHKLTVDGILGFAIALSNAFGLLLVLFLLGYGLVEFPRLLWRQASRKGRQRLCYHKVGLQAEHTRKTHREVSEAIATVHEVSRHFGPRDPLRKYLDIIESAVDLEIEADMSRDLASRIEDKDLEFEYADVHELGTLRRTLRKSQENYRREMSKYNKLVKEAFAAVHPDDAADDGSFSPFTEGSRGSRFIRKARRTYERMFAPALIRLSAVVLGLASACFVLSQLTIYEGLPMWMKKMSPIPAVIHAMEPNTTLVQLMCLLLLGYLVSIAWLSLFKLRIFSFYVMVPGHTPSASLLMNAMLMCRFCAPLAFNFMMIAMPMTQDDHVDVRQTTFYDQFGEKMLDLSYLGDFLGAASLTFTTFAPSIMLPYVLLVLFNRLGVFARACGACGCGGQLNFEDEWEDASGYNDLGQRLVDQEYENYYSSGLRIGKALEAWVKESGHTQRTLLGRLLNSSTKPSPSKEGDGKAWSLKAWLGRARSKGTSSDELGDYYEPVRERGKWRARYDRERRLREEAATSSAAGETTKPLVHKFEPSSAADDLDSIFGALGKK